MNKYQVNYKNGQKKKTETDTKNKFRSTKNALKRNNIESTNDQATTIPVKSYRKELKNHN